jgi:hypothetical protein
MLLTGLGEEIVVRLPDDLADVVPADLPTGTPSKKRQIHYKDIREIPDWCYPSYDGLDPRQFAPGLFSECDPYSEDELRAMSQTQMESGCRNAADPAACVAQGVAAAQAASDAAQRSDPDGTCEYKVQQENPWLSKVVSPEVQCKFQAGEYTKYFVFAGFTVFALWYLKQ